MTPGGSHLHDAGYHFDCRVSPERKWREPTEWTRTNVSVNRLSYTANGRTPYVAVNSLLTRLFFTSRGVFSPDEERSRGEPQRGVPPVDEGRAAHELQSPDEECSPGEPEAEVQSVDELQVAHELHSAHGVHSAHGLPDSHSCELQPPYSRLPDSHSSG
jgi:hypothetical protein